MRKSEDAGIGWGMHENFGYLGYMVMWGSAWQVREVYHYDENIVVLRFSVSGSVVKMQGKNIIQKNGELIYL